MFLQLKNRFPGSIGGVWSWGGVVPGGCGPGGVVLGGCGPGGCGPRGGGLGGVAGGVVLGVWSREGCAWGGV